MTDQYFILNLKLSRLDILDGLHEKITYIQKLSFLLIFGLKTEDITLEDNQLNNLLWLFMTIHKKLTSYVVV